MEKPNTRLHDENNGLDYVLVGDYYFPALILAEDSRPVGRWGRMYKRYLKEHHSARYQALLHPMRCFQGRLFTVDGMIEDEAPLKKEIYEQIRYYATTSVARRIEHIMTSLTVSIAASCCSPLRKSPLAGWMILFSLTRCGTKKKVSCFGHWRGCIG